MVSVKSLTIAALLSAPALADTVACTVNGATVALVDEATGVCPFTLPASDSVVFDFTSADDYNVQFYYALVNGRKYFTDIQNAGREIDIPANLLFGTSGVPFFQVSAQKSSPSNSTKAIRRRLMKESLTARDAESDLIAYLETLNGTEVAGSVINAVVPTNGTVSSSGAGSASGSASVTGSASGSASVTGSASATGTVTATDKSTTIVTITSCSDHKCTETTVPATWGPTTVTTNEEVTVLTTWCPETETVTKLSTTHITVTSCADHKCTETSVPVTWGPTTIISEGTTTIFTTWCPVESTEAPATAKPTTAGPATVEPTTAAPATVKPTTAAPATEAPATEAPDVTVTTQATKTVSAGSSSIYPTTAGPVTIPTANVAGATKASLLAFVAIPLAYFL